MLVLITYKRNIIAILFTLIKTNDLHFLFSIIIIAVVVDILIETPILLIIINMNRLFFGMLKYLI